MNTNQQGKQIRQEYSKLNTTLLDLLNFEFGKVRQTTVKGVVYYLVHDVCELLELTNTSNVIKQLSDTTVLNGQMKTHFKVFLEKVNPHRKVHLVSIEGVFEIVLKSKSRKCLEIKEYFSKYVLPRNAGLMGAQF